VINLKQFCGVDRKVKFVAAPFSIGDWTYATNGHVAIRVERVADVGEVEGAPRPIAGMFSGTHEWNTFPIVTLPIPVGQKCTACHGNGWNVECDGCEGTGEHGCQHDTCSCTHDCPDCDGTGRVVGWHDTPENQRIGCGTCEGQGTTLDQRRILLRPETLLQLRYLRLVLSLPGPIEIVDRPPLEPQIFRGTGWNALIMPMRYDARFGDRLVALEIDMPFRRKQEAAA